MSHCAWFRTLPVLVLALLVAVPGGAAAQAPRTLLDAFAAALEQAPEAQEAALERARAAQRVHVARAAFIPTVGLDASITRNRDEIELNGRPFLQRWDQSAQLEARVDVFAPRSIPALREARAGEQVADANATLRASEIRFAVANAYIDVLAADAALEVARQDVAARARTLERLQTAVDAGDGRTVDLESARLAELEARAALVAAEGSLASALVALHVWTGWERAVPEDLAPVDAALGVASPSGAGVQGRSEAVAIAAEGRQLELAWRGERWAAAPSVALVSRTTFGRASLRAPDGIDWTATLQLSWALFDWARVERARLARLDTTGSLYAMERFERDRRLATEQARVRLEAAESRVVARERSVEQARRVAQLTETAWQLGDATAFDVRDAEDTLRDAALSLVIAHLERDRARLDLAYASGVLEE